jgi:hypothetical protein
MFVIVLLSCAESVGTRVKDNIFVLMANFLHCWINEIHYLCSLSEEATLAHRFTSAKQ